MKTILLLSLLAIGCARPAPPPPTNPPEAGIEARAIFSRTTGQAEPALLLAANALLSAGTGLELAEAERCLREESRNSVKDLCLLLWAPRGEESGPLAAALLERGPQSRVAAVALSLRAPNLSGIPTAVLLEMLGQLAKDRPWLRGRLAHAWLRHNGSAPLAQLPALSAFISLPEDADSRDIAATVPALRLLSPAAFDQQLSAYCDPSAEGDSRLRCWRFLGSLAGRAGNHLPIPEWRAYRPLPGDSGWELFQRAFAPLAHNLNQL